MRRKEKIVLEIPLEEFARLLGYEGWILEQMPSFNYGDAEKKPHVNMILMKEWA